MMTRAFIITFILGISMISCEGQTKKTGGESPSVVFVNDQPNQKIDVLLNGALFTSYHYQGTLPKPVLFPLITASGKTLTRGFPIDPKPGERVDHPHHMGHWFNYGDVNGLDFWNNSDAIPCFCTTDLILSTNFCECCFVKRVSLRLILNDSR